LTRRDWHRLLHLLSFWSMKSGDMRGYRMVIHTFRQPGANEPVDVQKLTSSSAPFVILTHRVRWHAGVPYGYSHLSSTRGKRARWRAETNIVFCTFWPSRDNESGGRRRYLVVIRTFRQPRGTNLTVSRWCWSFDSDYFQNFCRILLSSSEGIQARRRTRFFSDGQGRSNSMA